MGANISKTELSKVYKLINEYSHNYEPMSSIEHTDKSESNEAIKTLLKIVEYSDRQHFEIMNKNYVSGSEKALQNHDLRVVSKR